MYYIIDLHSQLCCSTLSNFCSLSSTSKLVGIFNLCTESFSLIYKDFRHDTPCSPCGPIPSLLHTFIYCTPQRCEKNTANTSDSVFQMSPNTWAGWRVKGESITKWWSAEGTSNKLRDKQERVMAREEKEEASVTVDQRGEWWMRIFEYSLSGYRGEISSRVAAGCGITVDIHT